MPNAPTILIIAGASPRAGTAARRVDQWYDLLQAHTRRIHTLQTVLSDQEPTDANSAYWELFEISSLTSRFLVDGHHPIDGSLASVLRRTLAQVQPDIVISSLGGTIIGRNDIPSGVLRVLDAPRRAYRNGVLPGERLDGDPPAPSLLEEKRSLAGADLIVAATERDAAAFALLGARDTFVFPADLTAPRARRNSGPMKTALIYADKAARLSATIKKLSGRIAQASGWRVSVGDGAEKQSKSESLPDLIIIPLPISGEVTAGIVGEALRAGVPIVATRHGAAAFGDGNTIPCRETVEELALLALDAMSDAYAWQQLSMTAVANWSRLSREADVRSADILQKLLRSAPAPETPETSALVRAENQMLAMWDGFWVEPKFGEAASPTTGAALRAALTTWPLHPGLLTLAGLEVLAASPQTALKLEADAGLVEALRPEAEFPPLVLPASVTACVTPATSAVVLDRLSARLAHLVGRGTIVLEPTPQAAALRARKKRDPRRFAWRSFTVNDCVGVAFTTPMPVSRARVAFRLGGPDCRDLALDALDIGRGWRAVRSGLEEGLLTVDFEALAAPADAPRSVLWAAATLRRRERHKPVVQRESTNLPTVSLIPMAMNADGETWMVDCRLVPAAEWSTYASELQQFVVSPVDEVSTWASAPLPLKMSDEAIGQKFSLVSATGYTQNGNIAPALLRATDGEREALIVVGARDGKTWRWGGVAAFDGKHDGRSQSDAETGILSLEIPHTLRVLDPALAKSLAGLERVRLYATCEGDDPASTLWRGICTVAPPSDDLWTIGRLNARPGMPLVIPVAQLGKAAACVTLEFLLGPWDFGRVAAFVGVEQVGKVTAVGPRRFIVELTIPRDPQAGSVRIEVVDASPAASASLESLTVSPLETPRYEGAIDGETSPGSAQ